MTTVATDTLNEPAAQLRLHRARGQTPQARSQRIRLRHRSRRWTPRQPIVDLNQELVGFELLFRPTATDSVQVDDDMLATSTVISNAFTEIGLDQVIGDVDGYINVDADFLLSDLIDALPPGQIVLE